MPHYFFDVADGVAVRDDVGIHCTDPKAAVMEARRRMAEYLVHPAWVDGGAMMVTVRDDSGTSLFSLRMVYQLDGAHAVAADVP